MPRTLCGSVKNLSTGKMVCLGNFVAQWSRHRKDGAPRKLCGSVRWSRHRKDDAPRKLCGSCSKMV